MGEVDCPTVGEPAAVPGAAPPRAAVLLSRQPLCVPRGVGGVKCVIVSEQLRDVEPMAWDFVCGFARDNGLPMVEACLVDSAIRPVQKAPAP